LPPIIDTTYRLVIDSVINTSIDGVPLKRYYTTALDGLTFFGDGSFMDRIGGLDWLLPRRAIVHPGVFVAGPIRCYSDAQIDTSFQSIACDSLSLPLSLPLSISENLNNSNIKLYPNPSFNNLVIENLGQQKNDVRVEVRDVTGKLELIKNIGLVEKVTINTSHLPAGLYFVTIKDEQNVIATKKWVKAE